MKVTISKRGKLQAPDYLKAALFAAGTPIGLALQQCLDSGDFSTLKWKALAMASVAAGLLSIGRSLFAKPYVKISAPTNEAAEQIKKEL